MNARQMLSKAARERLAVLEDMTSAKSPFLSLQNDMVPAQIADEERLGVCGDGGGPRIGQELRLHQDMIVLGQL